MVGYFDHMTSIRFQFTLNICPLNSNAMRRTPNTIKNTCHGAYLHKKACFILAIQNGIYIFVYGLRILIKYAVPLLKNGMLVLFACRSMLAKRNKTKLANVFALVCKRERWCCLPAVPCLNKGNNPKMANFFCTCL